MKIRSKTLKRVGFVLLAVFLILGLLLPALLLPVATNAQATTPETDASCRRIASFSQRSDRELERRQARLEQVRSEQSDRFERQLERRSARITENRGKFDANLEEHLKRLGNRATTAEQAAAVVEFESAVRQAIEDRRQIIDETREDFLEGLRQAIGRRHQALDNALNRYQQRISTATAKAAVDCASGVDISTVTSELSTAIKAAKDNFKRERAAADRIGQLTRDLASIRRDRVQQARDSFRSAIESATEQLKDVLGVRAT